MMAFFLDAGNRGSMFWAREEDFVIERLWKRDLVSERVRVGKERVLYAAVGREGRFSHLYGCRKKGEHRARKKKGEGPYLHLGEGKGGRGESPNHLSSIGREEVEGEKNLLPAP